MRFSKVLPPLAVAVLMLPFAAARADEWVIDRALETRLSRNDNLYMQLDYPKAATFLTLFPSLGLSSRTETRDVKVTAAIAANKYLEGPANDTTDHNLAFFLSLPRELNQWTLNASSLRNSTLTSELATTGVVTARRQRTQNSLSGGWGHKLDDKTQATLALSGSQVRHERGPGLVDFDDNFMTLGLTRILFERASLTAGYTSRDYRTVDDTVRTKADSFAIGGQWQYSERLLLSVNAGRQKVHNEQTLDYYQCLLFPGGAFCVPKSVRAHSDSSGTNYSGSASYQFERGNLAASLARGLTASGTGGLLNTDTAALSYSHRHGDTLTSSLGGTLTRSRNPASSLGETSFSSLAYSLSWRLDQQVTLNLGYTRATQQAPGQAESTRANVVLLSLNWTLPPLSSSK